MAGFGPPPKDPSKRARRNKEPAPLMVLPAVRVEQPSLPTIYVQVPDKDGNLVRKRFNWPKITHTWWRMWAESPLSKDFTDSDWSFLLDTALIHARFWRGDTRLAGELRLRVAKFGATPEDRARLRITFAVADDAENGNTPQPATMANGARSRSRSKMLRAVD